MKLCKVNLFCIPFAGGSKYSYREFEANIPPYINMISLEYPGRGARVRESPLDDIRLLAADLYRQMKDRIYERDYIIYGHSMGGLVAYLVTRMIIEKNVNPPLHLVISGTAGPSASVRGEKKRHLLRNPDFMEEIKRLNGFPEELLEDEELAVYFEPILRSDFKASETYVHIPAPPMNIKCTVITGMEEDISAGDIQLWQCETEQEVRFEQMTGDHFFIFDHTKEMVDMFSEIFVKHSKTRANDGAA